MTPPNFYAPSLETMNALLPAFDFKAQIAANNLSVVYMANQRSLERQVAIKLLAPHVSESPEFRESFEITARTMARLNHPNLIGVYDSGLVDGMLYFVMEFVPGKSLARSAQGRQVDVQQALGLVSGISAGLTHAHQHGIVHGELTPGNVLLNQKAEPKVGNFGATHARTSAATATDSCYAAPELAKQGPSQAGDIFALGAILYELLTGHPHREGAAAPSTLSKCGEAMDAIWKKATHPDPAQRFPDAKAFAASLGGATLGGRAPKTAGMAAAKLKPVAAPPVSEKLAKEGKKLALPPKDADEEPSTTAPPVVKVGFNWKLLRNLVIIGILLYAISLAWDRNKRASEQRARAEAEALKEDQERKEQNRREEIRRAEERRKNAASGNTGNTAPPPVPQPSSESPEASLSRLRNALYNGERGEMPVGSVAKGDFVYFLVKEPMSWPEAWWFAEKHGGNIAIPNITADLAWLLSKMAAEEIGIWIGAARSGRNDWRLADGELWKPKKVPSGIGRFLALDKNGLLRGEGLKRKLPFVLQWRHDGKNPAQLEALLAKTQQSLASNSIAFPPGTLALRSRHFLYVARPTLWQDALKIAQSAGAILAVPSDISEFTDVAEIAGEANAPNGIWLGGFRRSQTWEWMTGEPWKTPRWASGVKDDAADRRLIIRPGAGLDHLSPNESASGFLLEWSSDSKGPSTALPAGADASSSASPSGNPEFDALTNRARDLLVTADRKRSEQLASNAKTFIWDLDAWLKGLPRSENLTWEPHVSLLKSSISKNRVPASVPLSSGIKLSANMAKIAQGCASRQDRIDADFLAEAERVRSSYTAKVRDMLSQTLKQGKGANAKTLSDALDQASTAEKWLASFGFDPKPANPIPGIRPAADPSRTPSNGVSPRPSPTESLIE